MSSDCHGPGHYRVAATQGGFGTFLDASIKSYDDRKSGMGMLIDSRAKFVFGDEPAKTFPSRWWGGQNGVFDTPHDASHMVRCDISLPLFWSPHICSVLSLSFFVSLILCLILSFFLSF